MTCRAATLCALLWFVAMSPPPLSAQSGRETFVGTAAVKTAAGTQATAPITVIVERTLSTAESQSLQAAFKSGGVAGLRQALAGVPPTGSIQIGDAPATRSRLTIARPVGDGRLLTIVTDEPIAFMGGSAPAAKPREGFELAVLDLTIDAAGNGTGLLAPAAKVTVDANGAFIVQDYGAEPVQLSGMRRR